MTSKDHKDHIVDKIIVCILFSLASGSLWAGAVVTDGTIGAPVSLSGPSYNIDASLGTVQGSNLYHSFSSFNLDSGEVANFTAPVGADIKNIFGRVTGGEVSHIDGTIHSSINGANLYLINPAGVIFGTNASIDVTGSFYVSTADNVQFADGRVFSATDPQDAATLSVAPATAFGFTSGQPAAIELNGAQLDLQSPHTLALVGGDVKLMPAVDGRPASISASDGSIAVVSLAADGDVPITDMAIDTSRFDRMGSIELSGQSALDSSGASGGHIVIRGGKLILDNARISANASGEVNNDGQLSIDITTTDSIELADESVISADLDATATGTANDIRIKTRNLALLDWSHVRSQTAIEDYAFGNTGNILVDAKFVDLDNYSSISTQIGDIYTFNGGEGNTGDITIVNAESLSISRGSRISTFTLFGPGTSGDIKISADNISINGIVDSADYSLEDFTGVDAGTLQFGSSGDIEIRTENLTLDNNARIRSETFGDASDGPDKAGDIRIDAVNASILNGSLVIVVADDAAAGSVTMNVENNLVVSGVSPNSDSFIGAPFLSGIRNVGAGGSHITINAEKMALLDGGFVSNNNENTTGIVTKPGDIFISANSLTVDGHNSTYYDFKLAQGENEATALKLSSSQISSSASLNVENAGSISVTADTLQITNNGSLFTDTFFFTSEPSAQSRAGNIDIHSTHLRFNGANISTSSGQVNSGEITIYNSDEASIRNSQLQALVKDDNGNGGKITIQSDELFMDNNRVIATAEGGNGGEINILANDLLITSNNVFDVHSTLAADGKVTIVSDFQSDREFGDLSSKLVDTSILITNACNRGEPTRSTLAFLQNANRVYSTAWLSSDYGNTSAGAQAGPAPMTSKPNYNNLFLAHASIDTSCNSSK